MLSNVVVHIDIKELCYNEEVMPEHKRVVHLDQIMVVGLVPADPLQQLCLDLSILGLAFLGFADFDSD